MNQRTKVLIAAGVPILLVVILLIWGTARTGGQRARPGINEVFGEVEVPAEMAKDFELTLLDGRTLRLSDLRGKVVMVDFWASWCNPCKVEGPMLAEAYDGWRESGVEFVGISIWDQQPDVEAFITLNRIKYQNGIDSTGQIAINYGVKGIPEKFFITADGRLARKVIGPMTRAKLDSILEKLTLAAILAPAS
jgi:cytochrome c biogenesis protein CcmG/thiol:disulfide interchange protein DsbE